MGSGNRARDSEDLDLGNRVLGFGSETGWVLFVQRCNLKASLVMFEWELSLIKLVDKSGSGGG